MGLPGNKLEKGWNEVGLRYWALTVYPGMPYDQRGVEIVGSTGKP